MNKNILSVEGKVALVTGASSGLGAHFSKVLATAGAKVVVGARRVEKLDSLVCEIEASGGSAIAVAMDITDSDSVIRAPSRWRCMACAQTVLAASVVRISSSS